MFYDSDMCFDFDVCETDEFDQLTSKMITEILTAIFRYINLFFRHSAVLFFELIFIAFCWYFSYHVVFKKTKLFKDILS